MARTLEEAERMIRWARQTGALLQVGHLERFNPAVRALMKLVSEPKFFEVHRLGEFTERSLDIDVVLDLMIHDLDIVLSLVPSEIRAIHAVGVPILTDRVDIANARLEFANGCIANVTASRISREKVRKLRVFQPNAYISLDYTRQELDVYRLVGSLAPGERPRIVSERIPVVRDEPLRAQLESFLSCAREGSPPLVSGEDGRRALALALRILSALGEHEPPVEMD
jgi:predicted dehydrogenase